MKLINIGFGNMVSAGRVVAVVSPDSAPVKRLVKEARERGMLIDAPMAAAPVPCSSWTPIMWCSRPFSRKRWQAVRPGRRAKHTEEEQTMENDKYSVCGLRRRRYRQGQRGQGTARGPPGDRKDRLRHHPRTAPRGAGGRGLLLPHPGAVPAADRNDQVVEHNFYNGNYYGTLREEVDKRLEAGKVVVLVIDVHGAANIRRMFPGATTVFLLPPSVEELEHRLRGRGTETEDSISERLPPPGRSWPSRISSPSSWSTTRSIPAPEDCIRLICQRPGATE